MSWCIRTPKGSFMEPHRLFSRRYSLGRRFSGSKLGPLDHRTCIDVAKVIVHGSDGRSRGQNTKALRENQQPGPKREPC